MKCVIQREFSWGKGNVSFSANIIGEMKCVIQREINWGNEISQIKKSYYKISHWLKLEKKIKVFISLIM